ncbi:hypothetical protein WJX82_002225 [Trebouxia sp. C0006]
MAEVCKEPVDCDAAGPSAPMLGAAFVPEKNQSIKQKEKKKEKEKEKTEEEEEKKKKEKEKKKEKKKRTRCVSQMGVLDSQRIDTRPGSQLLQTSEPPFQQAEPQPEHRVLADGSTEAAKHADDAPKRKKRKVTPSQSTDNLAANRQRSHQSPTVDTPVPQQAAPQPSSTAPDHPKEPQESVWAEGSVSQVYIDKDLAKQLQDMLPSSWMPAVLGDSWVKEGTASPMVQAAPTRTSAAILGKIPPPPYDAAAGTAQRNSLAAESSMQGLLEHASQGVW